jgi:hypothetical protein
MRGVTHPLPKRLYNVVHNYTQAEAYIRPTFYFLCRISVPLPWVLLWKLSHNLKLKRENGNDWDGKLHKPVHTHTVWIPSAGSSTHQENVTTHNAQTGIRQDPAFYQILRILWTPRQILFGMTKQPTCGSAYKCNNEQLKSVHLKMTL